jgi:muramoyltetrapeptide carboxypeptidase
LPFRQQSRTPVNGFIVGLRNAILSLHMDIPTIQPPKLIPGDTIAIVAPAGTIEQRDGFYRNIATLERMGFKVRYDERIFHSFRYLAGQDDARAEELMGAFDDASIQAIMALRGGYGCSRLIPYLKEKRLRSNPKIFIGFSDLTTLHLFFRRRFGWTTIHGPMAASPALGNISPERERNFLSLLTDPEYYPLFSFDGLETWSPGVAEGILTGGCLSIIAASIGTSYEIKTEGKILFLEDFGEPPYRLDRMLTHLHLAGKLHSVSGVLLGSFLECEPTQGGYTAAETLRDILTGLNVPVLAGFPAGHDSENWAFPIGAKVRLDADARTVEFLDSAVK